MFVSALVVPSFKDNLISVGQLTKTSNVLFTEKGVYLMAKQKVGANANLMLGSGADNLTHCQMTE